MHKDDFKGIDDPPITPDIPPAIPHPQNQLKKEKMWQYYVHESFREN